MAIGSSVEWAQFHLGDVYRTIGALLLLLGRLALYDVVARRRRHPATLVGATVFLAMRILAADAIAVSEFGLSFVRGLK